MEWILLFKTRELTEEERAKAFEVISKLERPTCIVLNKEIV